MECEICGRSAPGLCIISVDGVEMSVCPACRGHGAPVSGFAEERPKTQTKPLPSPAPQRSEPELEIVPDYAQRVSRARQQMGWEQKALAAKINEKESVVRNVEHGHFEPNPGLARKLEKTLGITLLQYGKNEKVEIKHKDGTLTLGDVVRVKRK